MRWDGRGHFVPLNYVKFCLRPRDRSRGPRKLIFAGKIGNKVERGGKSFKIFLVL